MGILRKLDDFSTTRASVQPRQQRQQKSVPRPSRPVPEVVTARPYIGPIPTSGNLTPGKAHDSGGEALCCRGDSFVCCSERDPHVLAPARSVELTGGNEDPTIGEPTDRRSTFLARVAQRYRPASELSTVNPAPRTASINTLRRSRYRSRWMFSCWSSPKAAVIAAWIGSGRIMPACLRTSSSSDTRAGSP